MEGKCSMAKNDFYSDLIKLLPRNGRSDVTDKSSIQELENVFIRYFPNERLEPKIYGPTTINKLTAMALHYASENEADPRICLLVKDLLTGVFKEAGDNPPSARIFSTFASWGLHVDLKNIVLERDPIEPVFRLSESLYSREDNMQRYIPCNFTVEDLAALLLSAGDFPKTKLIAKRLFHKKEAESHKHEKGLRNERT
jgi:hypothetical protein